MKLKYGSAADQPWLDHVRLSSVRFNNGGSGSCVSVDGLAFTNHHVGATCIQQLSTGGTDYMRTGFYANTRGDEAKCPDLELKVLTGIEDVTSEVNGALKPGMSAAQAGQARRAATANIEQDCAKSTGLRCDVGTFYSGEVYNLYRYKGTRMCAWCSRQSSMPHFSAVIPTISPIRATTWTSRFSESTRTASLFISTITWVGRQPELKRTI
ncbi:MAG: hypothetical protein DMG69_30820 [Acidobacteria bacterium]|nr:MAG: hypothetical protein DMG69_30820 [Acidobacteriota bacterium]